MTGFDIFSQPLAIQVCWVKWECCRRNEAYRENYEAYAEDPRGAEKPFIQRDPPMLEGETIEQWMERAEREGRAPMQRLASKANLIRWRWGFSPGAPILSPDTDLDPGVSWPFKPYTGIDRFHMGEVNPEKFPLNQILLRVDIAKPKRDLMAGFEMEIDEAKRSLGDAGSRTDDKKRLPERHLACLAVWDKRVLEDKGFDEIGAELGQKKDTVYRQYVRAEELVLRRDYMNLV